MRWDGKTLMEAQVTDDRRFLSHACLEPKVERDPDGLHLIIPYRNKAPASFRRPLGWTLSNPFSFVNLFLVVFSGKNTEVGKIEGEREVQQACCCCVCEKICTTTVAAAAQFGV